ncbi:glucose transporter type 1-like [Argiope bruennichi]|uniref:glucose transporter type 1-like n=1 Tax=Argiope bruennichi TaxID=94029 RepID=UPI00249550AB|nr:glucose transporter type 1-like [Argiope bruennichi]
MDNNGYDSSTEKSLNIAVVVQYRTMDASVNLSNLKEPIDGGKAGFSIRGRSKYGLTCSLVFAIFAAVLGMVQFGYNTAVINAPQKVIQDFITSVHFARTGNHISDDNRDLIWSIAVSIFAIGGMVGGITGGTIATKFGRKGGLLLNNIMGVAGAALMTFSKACGSYEMLILGRLAIGFNCGLNTALVPMYLSEISPVTLRGGLGTLNQLGVTVGLLLSMVLGIQDILGTEERWPYLFGVAVIPAALQLLLLPLCPESPRFLLITKQQEYSAREALEKLRCTVQVEDDLEEMRNEERAQEQEPQMTVCQVMRNKSLQLPLLIAIVMQLSQQLTGINAVFYYSTGLFMNAGLSEAVSHYATMGVGVIMVVMTLVSIPLMDRAGRRTLHLYGLGGMFFCSIFITISLLVRFLYEWVTYLSVVSTLSFVVFFAIGPGSIPWMITAELFSHGPRPAAMSIAVFVNWSSNFLVGLVFPQMQRVFENYSFLPFTGLLAIFWIFSYRKVPETKNRTFEEIAALFRREEVVNVNGLTTVVQRKPPVVHHQSPELVAEEKNLETYGTFLIWANGPRPDR